MALKGVKRRDANNLKQAATFVALALLLAVLLNSLHNVYTKKKNAENLLVRMEKEKTELVERKAELKQTLSRLDTKEGLDFEIRKRFNVAAAGEDVAIIVAENQSSSTPVSSDSAWQKFKNFFTGWFR